MRAVIVAPFLKGDGDGDLAGAGGAQDGVADFTEATKERIGKHLVCTKTGREGSLHVSSNEEAYAEARKHFGYLCW